ncbi:MAG: hypothetical protein ACKVHP_01080 [Verrucomicrobiales bacterium]
MMGDEDNPARALYWDAACNRAELEKDGLAEEYLSLGGGDEDTESLWRSEFIDHWAVQLSVEELEPLRQLRNANAHEALLPLLQMSDYGDDFAKFWFAFTLNVLSQEDSEFKQEASDRAQALWREILIEPKGVKESHRALVKRYMLKAFEATTAEEYVENYTRQKLSEFV